MASVAATGSAMTSHDVQLDSSQWQAAQQDFASKLKAYRQSLGSVASDLQSQLRAREGRLAALQSCLEVEARVRDERNKIAQMVVSAARAGRLLHDEIESEYTAQLSLLDGEEAKSKRTLAQIAAEDETDKADTNAVSAAEARLTELDTMYADLFISAKTAARCLIRWADAKQRADAVFDEMTKIVHTRPASDRLITSADLQDIVTAQNASAAYDLADSAYLVACGSTGLRDYLVADQLVRACRAFTPSKSTDGERTARITVPSCAGYIQGWSTLRDDHQIVKAAHEQIFARPDVTSGHEALTDRQRVRADTIRYLQQGNQHETCFHAMAKAFGDMEAGRK